MDALTFRCTACGNCCRNLRVAVTLSDVARLASATGRRAEELVEWLAPDAVDMTGEPGSFVELSEGRRLMVLAQLEGACRLLGADNRCTVYPARPLDCRAYPFDFTDATPHADADADSAAAPPHRLQLLPLAGCDYASDGHNDPAELSAIDTQRWRELTRYQALVARWNHLASHRRRLHHRVGTPGDFLSFALSQVPTA